jgi:ATP-dependent Clp protease ATP-binding subunit ClpA
MKSRADFAIKTCQESGPNLGTFLVRLQDQKQYQLTDRIWSPAQTSSLTEVSNGIFEYKGADGFRIDLDQFDAELRRFAFLSDGDTVLDDKGKKVDSLEKVRAKYPDLVADSIAHPERYQETSDKDITQHFLEAFWARRSVVLLGKPGTGKSSAIRAFARDVGRGLVPGVPRTTEIFEIKVSTLLSGTTYVGMTEQRIGELISAAQQSGCIFFIDEFHSLAGAGTSSNNSNDVTQYIKKGLEAGELLLIGTDTDHEFYNGFAHDPAFIERFDIKKLNAPDGPALEEIIRARFKSEFNLDFSPALVQLAISLSQNYDVTAAQPRSAVNLLRKAVARASATGGTAPEITAQFLKETAVIKYGFDPFQLNPASLRAKLAQLRPGLDAELIGQDDAKDLIRSVWARKITGVGDDRRVNSLLLAGPPGVGKTRAAELSADLMGYKKTIVEMNKFAHGGVELFRREIYQALLEHPFRVFVLDEIEKAHSTVQAGALAMLQTGSFRVTEEMPQGKTVTREVSAKHAVFFLTSNAAAEYIKRQISKHGSVDEKELRRYLAEDNISEAILSRIQHVVPMSTPSQAEFKAGLTRSLAATLQRESARHGFRFTLEDEGDFISEVMKSYHEDTDYRDISKHLTEIEDLIVQALMKEDRAPGSEIKLNYSKPSEPPARKKQRREPPPYYSYYN